MDQRYQSGKKNPGQKSQNDDGGARTVESVRLNKYLAECGVCSRREADRLIGAGRVTVGGQQASVGMSLSLCADGTPESAVAVDGKAVSGKAEPVVLAFYKPVGATCTERDRHAERTIADYVNYPERVTYAGRLDKDSEGLLLLTNDGDLIDRMMRGAERHEKEYEVRVDREVTEEFLRRMERGIYLPDLGQKTRPCRAERTGEQSFRLILTQGLNRQIRRMCEACGYHVRALRRVRVMNITLDGLAPGEWRKLGEAEMRELYRAAR